MVGCLFLFVMYGLGFSIYFWFIFSIIFNYRVLISIDRLIFSNGLCKYMYKFLDFL